MKEPWRERWIHPDMKVFLGDIKSAVMGLIGAGAIVVTINGIYALCEWLKTVNIS